MRAFRDNSELRKDVWMDLTFPAIQLVYQFSKKQFKKVLVNPSVLLLKRKVVKLAINIQEEIFG